MTMLATDQADLSASIARLNQEIETLKTKIEMLERRPTQSHLPDTSLVSDSFLTRAFTVWGHYFVAQLIISIPFFLLGLCAGGL
jgi:hypothetical protein